MCYDVNFKTNIELITAYLPDLVMGQAINFEVYMRAHIQAQAFLPHPIVVMENGQKTLKLMEWGVIANYMNTEEKIKKGRASMCNFRSEKVLEKTSYWYRIRKNRCLIPVVGIYEHRKVAGFKTKIPYHVGLKSQPMFFIPALWADYVNQETGEVKQAYSMGTRSANEVMAQIHNDSVNGERMPLFVPLELALLWLTDASDEAIEKVIDFKMPSEELDYYPVFTIRTQKERPDCKMKNEPFEWENLPPIEI